MSMLRTFQGSWELLGEFSFGGDYTTTDFTSIYFLRDGTKAYDSTVGYSGYFDFTNKPPFAKELPPEANGVEVIFIADSTGGFRYSLFGHATANGPAEHIADGTGVVDTGAAWCRNPITSRLTPNDGSCYYASTLTATSKHIKTVSAVNSGNTEIAKLIFDAAGLRWIYANVYDITSAATDCSNVWVIYRYF